MAEQKENSQLMDQLLSKAYDEIEGSKSGEKELAFIESVFDFLNRQSTYLSNKKTCDKLIKLTNKTIDNASKKKNAINKKKKKKKKEKVFTKADKSIDHEQIAENKAKRKSKIKSAAKKDGKIKKDKYSKLTKEENAKKKAKKAKQDKSGNYQNEAKNEEEIPVDDESINVMELMANMYAQFEFDFDKDYKTLVRILSKSASKRVASAYLIELCKIIRLYAPYVVLAESMPIRGTNNGHKEIPDRAFRISTNYEGKIFISDYEFGYELVPDPKSDKYLRGDMLSNTLICHDDASSLNIDHRSIVIYRQKPSSMKTEALMALIPGKPQPKRNFTWKPSKRGDSNRCVYADSFCHATANELPKGYSVVIVKNGKDYVSLNKVPVIAGGPKLQQKEYTKFDKDLPDAKYLCLNKRHDALFILSEDFENFSIRISCVLLNKSVKKQSKIIFVKQFEDFDFEDMGYPANGWWPKAISMCYLRDRNQVLVGIQKHLFVIAENPMEKYDYYTFHMGKTSCLLYDIAEHPKKKNAILAVDGQIGAPKMFDIEIL